MMHNRCPWTTILSKLIGLQLRMNQSKQPPRKRGQTSQGTSSDENLEGVIDLKEVEDPASKRRCLIADWPEEEDEEVEVSGIVASS
jgi:hypothetical protein